MLHYFSVRVALLLERVFQASRNKSLWLLVGPFVGGMCNCCDERGQFPVSSTSAVRTQRSSLFVHGSSRRAHVPTIDLLRMSSSMTVELCDPTVSADYAVLKASVQ